MTMQLAIAGSLCVFVLTAIPVKSSNPGAKVGGQQDPPNAIQAQEAGRQATSGLPSPSNPLGLPSSQGVRNGTSTQTSFTPTSVSTPTFGSPDPLTQLLMDHQKKSNELVQTYTQQITQLQTQLNQDLQKLQQDLNVAMNSLLLQGK